MTAGRYGPDAAATCPEGDGDVEVIRYTAAGTALPPVTTSSGDGVVRGVAAVIAWPVAAPSPAEGQPVTVSSTPVFDLLTDDWRHDRWRPHVNVGGR